MRAPRTWRRSVTDAVTVALALVAALLVPAPAHAHTASSFYWAPNTWAPGTDVSFRLQVGYPTGYYRNAVAYAISQWNQYGGSAAPDFFWNLSDGFGSFEDPCGNDASVVVWLDIDYLSPTAAGAVNRCVPYQGYQGYMTRFSLAVDSDTDWYAADSDTVPAGKTDLRSVLTHEFGHATGWSGHYVEHVSGPCEQKAALYHVMCADTVTGTNWMRTLKEHDIHTFDAAYPNDGGSGSGGGGGGGGGTSTNENPADLNDDDIADLARYVNNGHLYVYPGRGSVEEGVAFWAPRDHGGDWGGTVSVALGDLNRDGIADLARVVSNGHLYVYPGQGGVEPGAAFWAPRDHGGDWGGTVSIAMGDLNRDGIADLIRYRDDGTLWVYPGRGSVEPGVAFWAPRYQGADWGGTVSIAAGDLNRDGIADLARYRNDGTLWVYPGRGSVEEGVAFWAPRYHGPDWGGTVAITLGDLNRDGIADLARYRNDGTLWVYPGRGSVEEGVAFWAPRYHGADWGGTVSIAL